MLRALDRLLKWPKLSAKGKKRLGHAQNRQRNAVRFGRKALTPEQQAETEKAAADWRPRVEC